MSVRLDKSWLIVASYHALEGDRCVDIFKRPDDTFGFELFRMDPEDMGLWTPVAYYSGAEYPTETSALERALQRVGWLSEVVGVGP